MQMLSAREINYDGLSQWSFPYVILDLETTGGTPLHDRIIEIALIRFEEGMESDRWETLVNPGMPISPFITRLTGISNGMAQDAPSFEEVAHKLYSFLEGAVLAAHTSASTTVSLRTNTGAGAPCSSIGCYAPSGSRTSSIPNTRATGWMASCSVMGSIPICATGRWVMWSWWWPIWR
jgi:hypothetical protein